MKSKTNIKSYRVTKGQAQYSEPYGNQYSDSYQILSRIDVLKYSLPKTVEIFLVLSIIFTCVFCVAFQVD